jgi:hypothetical protein
MKKTILTLVLILTVSFLYSQKRYIKKLEEARNYFNFYKDSPFNNVFYKVGKYKRNKIYIEKNCCGVFLLIQSKRIKQLSNYYLVKHISEARFNNLEDINDFIVKLQYEESED